jgi:hypothetical protein
MRIGEETHRNGFEHCCETSATRTENSSGRHGDFTTLRPFVNALVGRASLHPKLAKIFHGNAYPEGDQLVELLRWFEQTLKHGTPFDERIFTNRCAQLREHLWGGHGANNDEPAWPVLFVSQEGRVKLPNGLLLHLTGPGRRIVVALAQARTQSHDACLSVWDLFESGWPGEKPLAHSAANRVYVTMTRLRAQGLGPWLERIEAGYRFVPDLKVEFV